MQRKDATLAKSTLTEDVRGTLIRRIEDGLYLPGARLPSEVDLAKELGVSIAPIRAAFAQLVAAGMISRRPGSGTFVNPEPIRHQLANLSSFTQELRRLGIEFSIEISEFGPTSDLASRVSERFPGVEKANLTYLERLVISEDQVRTFVRSWFKTDVLDEMPSRDYFIEGNSLYSWFEQHGEDVRFVETALRVVAMDEDLAGRFEAEWGRPVVLVETRAYSRNGQIEYAETYYDHTTFAFTATQVRGAQSNL